jgi:hypothetical protein
MPEPLIHPSPTHTFDAEVFSAGTWNGDTYTEADLRELAANFERLRGEVKPPLKFGHDAGQTLTGQSDGDPALGWVEAVRVAGDKLIATFAGVPQVVMDAIHAGRYRRVSAEIWFNLRRGGQTFGKALKAVALLGADLPAVTNLQDLTAYLTGQPAWQAERVLTFTGPLRAEPFTPVAHSVWEQIMTETPSAALPFKPLEAELETELEELRAYKVRQEAQLQQEQRRRHEEAFRTARQAALAFCEAQVRAGKLAPALRDRVTREIDAQAQHYSAAAGLRVPWSLVQALLGSDTAVPLGSEAAFSVEDPAADGGDGDPSARLAALANRKMVELNLGYSQAAQYVLKTNPGLARAYRDYTLNPNTGG